MKEKIRDLKVEIEGENQEVFVFDDMSKKLEKWMNRPMWLNYIILFFERLFK
jgi:hypothetical protein